MSYVNSKTIKELREAKKLTQRQLADALHVSDKCISKWETGRGLPDISILSELAQALGVSMAELMTGDIRRNGNRSANMLRSAFYVCPVCGNVIYSVGSGDFSCCGVSLPPAEPDGDWDGSEIKPEIIDGEYYVGIGHEMTKSHYISFIAYVTTDTVQIKKLYPEQNAECSFARRGQGVIYAYCNRHGLAKITP